MAVCSGYTTDWEEGASKSTSNCDVVPVGIDGAGTHDITFEIDDDRAVYVAGTIWPVGFCAQDGYDTTNKYAEVSRLLM